MRIGIVGKTTGPGDYRGWLSRMARTRYTHCFCIKWYRPIRPMASGVQQKRKMTGRSVLATVSTGGNSGIKGSSRIRHAAHAIIWRLLDFSSTWPQMPHGTLSESQKATTNPMRLAGCCPTPSRCGTGSPYIPRGR